MAEYRLKIPKRSLINEWFELSGENRTTDLKTSKNLKKKLLVKVNESKLNFEALKGQGFVSEIHKAWNEMDQEKLFWLVRCF